MEAINQVLFFLFSIECVAFEMLGYQVSWLELIGTFFGLWCVIECAREKVISWPVGLVNVVFFFILFYQIQLYSDMVLQGYFFATGVYGWWKWTHPAKDESKKSNELKITLLSKRSRNVWLVSIGLLIASWGWMMSGIHSLLPVIFAKPAAFPYWDSATTVMSVAAQLFLTRKKLESWVLWIAVDIICVVLYIHKGVLFLSIEYGIFLCIATVGLISWLKEYRKQGDSNEQNHGNAPGKVSASA